MPIWDSLVEALAKKLFEIAMRISKRKKLSKIMTDSMEVVSITRRLIERSGLMIDCAFLCLAYNGGRSGTYRFRSILAGSWDANNMEDFRIWNYKRIPIDVEYAVLIEQIKIDKVVDRETKSMVSGKLKAEFKAEGLSYVQFHYIDKTSEGLWFLKVGTVAGAEKDFLDWEHMHLLNLAKKDICTIIDQNK